VNAPHPAESMAAIKPPQDIEAEREVLSAVIRGGTNTLPMLDDARPHWFSVARHHAVFLGLAQLRRTGKPLDLVLLRDALTELGQLDRAGGIGGISALQDGAQGFSDHIPHYLEILRDKATRRVLLEHARRVEAQVLGDSDSLEALVDSVKAEYQTAIESVGPTEPPPDPLALPTVAELSADGESWLEVMQEAPKSLMTYDGKPFVRQGKVGLLVAPGGTGKSFSLVQLAVAVATGGDWLGAFRVEKRGRVLLACGEEDAEEVRRRLFSATRGLDAYSLNLVAQNVVPLGLAGQRTAFLERHDGAIVQTPWYRSVLAALQPHEWQLVILDPLSRWGGPEVETDAYAATELVTLLETLTKAPGNPTVIAAHHERKGMGGTSDASSVRGSSALVDGPRWVANLRRRKDSDLLELAVTKANNTVPPPPIVLKRGPMGVLRRATVDEIEDEKRIERPAWTPGAPRGGVGENQL
jgi:regulatory protein RepA